MTFHGLLCWDAWNCQELHSIQSFQIIFEFVQIINKFKTNHLSLKFIQKINPNRWTCLRLMKDYSQFVKKKIGISMRWERSVVKLRISARIVIRKIFQAKLKSCLFEIKFCIHLKLWNSSEWIDKKAETVVWIQSSSPDQNLLAFISRIQNEESDQASWSSNDCMCSCFAWRLDHLWVNLGIFHLKKANDSSNEGFKNHLKLQNSKYMVNWSSSKFGTNNTEFDFWKERNSLFKCLSNWT